MGNCLAKQHHHVRVVDHETARSKKRNRNIRDATDSTESERDNAADQPALDRLELDSSSLMGFTSAAAASSTTRMLLEPLYQKREDAASPTSPIMQPQPSDDTFDSEHTISFVVPERAPTTTSLASGNYYHPKQGRALRARLEKSRHLQITLHQHQQQQSSSMQQGVLITTSSTVLDDDQQHAMLPHAPSSNSSLYQYSMAISESGGAEEETTTATEQLNQQFDATVSRGMIWAEMELPPPQSPSNNHNDNKNNNNEDNNDDRACALALSRQQPTLDNTSPLMFVAVGTEQGQVTVTELLDDSSLAAQMMSLYNTVPNNHSSSSSSIEHAHAAPQAVAERRLGDSIQVAAGTGRIRSLDFSPNGQYLAVGGDDCICTVFNLVYGKKGVNHHTNKRSGGGHQEQRLVELRTVAEFERVDRVYAVKFSPDGRYLAMGGFDGTIAIVGTRDIADILSNNKNNNNKNDDKSPELVVEISSDGLIFTLDWSPDAKYLAFGGSDKICSIVDVSQSWDVVQEIRRSASIQSVKWHSVKSRFLAIGSSDVAIIDCNAGYLIHAEIDATPPVVSPAAARKKVSARVNALCWSPNGSYLVICDSSSTCRVIETKTFCTVQEIRRSSTINAVDWGQQAPLAGVPRRYLVVGDDKSVAILKAGVEMHSRGSGSMSDDMSSSFSSASFFSHRGGENRGVGDWVLKENAFRDMDDNNLVGPTDSIEQVLDDLTFQNANKVVLAVCFSRGSKSRPSTYFAYATGDGRVTVKTIADWTTRAVLKFPQPVTSLLFSNGSRYLVMGCEDSNIYVSSTGSKWPLIGKTALSAAVKTVIFSKDNGFVGAGTSDGNFCLLDPKKSYSVSGAIDDSDSPVSAVDWCSKTLAVGREDGTVRLYDTAKVSSGYYSPIAELARRSIIRSVAFGLRGRFLAVGTSDGLVGVYSAKGGWMLCHQFTCVAGVASLRWNPNGRSLAIGDDKGSLRLLDTVLWADVKDASSFFGSADLLAGSGKSASCLGFSQDGKLLALAQRRTGVTVVDIVAWKLAFSLKKNGDDESSDDEASLAVSPFPDALLSME